MRSAFIDAWKERWPVEFLCSIMQVTSCGFRAWRMRPLSAMHASPAGVWMSQRQREDHGIARRANAILLLDDGESCARIAKFLYLDDDTIRGWHKTYLQDGWDALALDGWKGGQSRRPHRKVCA